MGETKTSKEEGLMPRPQDLGIDLEKGYVDGVRIGRHLARFVLTLRSEDADHYSHRTSSFNGTSEVQPNTRRRISRPQPLDNE